MRYLACLFFFLCVPFSYGADRLKVTAPPPGQEMAEELVGSLASACNAGDFIAFIDHFTPSQGRKIRGRMEDVFIKHQPQMDIRRVTLLSEEKHILTFGVKYAWHDKGRPEEVVASKITARKIDGDWKLDAEKVRSISRLPSDSGLQADQGFANALPANWNPFNPPGHLIDPDLEHLRGDIGFQPGRGCANGRCER